MKRVLCLLVLLLIVGSAYTPFYAAARPVDSRTVDAATGESTISKWGGVASLKVKPLDAVTRVNGKLKTASGIEVKVEERADAVEYSWVLAARPALNVFSLKLEFVGCQFYYQPPLDAGAYPKGWTANATHVFDDKGVLREYRPINVVGSYAVYGNQRNGVYETGKVVHIYRPLVTDAAGKTAWGVMNIVGDTLSVTVNPAWLDNAKYPVVVDPTFGVTGIGLTDQQIVKDALYGMQVTTPGAPLGVSSITGYFKASAPAAGKNFKSGFWVNVNNGTVVGTTSSSTDIPAAYAWTTATFTTVLSLTPSTNYMFGILGSDAGNTIYIRYDAGGTGYLDNANSYATPQVFNWDGAANKLFSLYATYSNAPTITSSIIAMDDTDNIYTMKKYYTFTTVVNDPDGATDIKAISVRGTQGAAVRWLVNATSLDGVASYAIITGASTIDLDTASCTFTENGNAGTLVLKIRFEWDATNEADCELAVWARDVFGASVGWTTVQTDYFDVISRLVTRDFAANVTTAAINSPILISGNIRYATDPTTYTASTSYPPDAQFTAVKIYDGEGEYLNQDTTIVNGAFSVTVTSAAVLKTTTYTVYLDLVPDYTDGYAPDGDVIYVSTGATFPFVDFLGNAFAFFGLIGAVTGTIYGMLTAFAAWFTTAAALMVSLITSIISLIFFVGGTVIDWFTRITTTMITLLTIIGNLFNGTLVPGSLDIWAVFNVSAWIDAVPIFMIILWLDSIPRRSHRTGRSQIELIIGDIQIVGYLVGEVWQWTNTIFNFVLSTISTIASRF